MPGIPSNARYHPQSGVLKSAITEWETGSPAPAISSPCPTNTVSVFRLPSDYFFGCSRLIESVVFVHFLHAQHFSCLNRTPFPLFFKEK